MVRPLRIAMSEGSYHLTARGNEQSTEAFKAKVGMEALLGVKTVDQTAGVGNSCLPSDSSP